MNTVCGYIQGTELCTGVSGAFLEFALGIRGRCTVRTASLSACFRMLAGDSLCMIVEFGSGLCGKASGLQDLLMCLPFLSASASWKISAGVWPLVCLLFGLVEVLNLGRLSISFLALEAWNCLLDLTR